MCYVKVGQELTRVEHPMMPSVLEKTDLRSDLSSTTKCGQIQNYQYCKFGPTKASAKGELLFNKRATTSSQILG
jgi:hypothetical protein